MERSARVCPLRLASRPGFGGVGPSSPVLSFRPMARITIACWGSHGDFDPSLGLALGLRARGHAVRIAPIKYFEPHVRAAGLGFHPIRPDVRPDDSAIVSRIMNGSRGTEYLMNELIFPNLRAMYEDIAPLADSTAMRPP